MSADKLTPEELARIGTDVSEGNSISTATARKLFAHVCAIEAELAAKDAALAEARGILLRVCNRSRPHGMVDGNPHLLPHEVMVEARLFVANSPNRPTLEKHQ